MRYNNYHKHDHKGNIRALDSIAKAEDYINRAIELNHNIVFSTEHGFQGDLFELKSLIDEKNKTLDNEHKLKMAVGCEFYYVDDINDRDRRNYHLIVVALNNEGCRQINEACSIANVDGFYYKPRIDKKILFEVFNPKDVIVTTACVAGILSKSDHVELLKEMKEHFGDNLFLEVQNHNKEIQKHINKIALKLSKELDIKIIHANDSHYIYPHEAQYRTQFLKAKGVIYPEEDDFILDYPTSSEIKKRYIEQGILNEEQIYEALNNTLVFDRCEELTIINDEIKLPSISKNPKKELDSILNFEWKKTKPMVDQNRIKEYEKAIAFERNIIDETNMEDYFILDYHIVKRAMEIYNGLLTKTGRGCFTEDALVHTKNSLKSIKDVQIGDYVITESGNFNKVLNTMKYDIEEELVQIKHIYGTDKYYPTICTLDHKILINRDGILRWVQAKNIVKTDYVCVPKINITDSMNKVIDLNDYNVKGFNFDDKYIYERTSAPYKYSPSDVARKIGVGKSLVENFANMKKNCFSRKKDKYKALMDYIPFDTQEEYSKYVKSNQFFKLERYIKIDKEFNTFIGLMYGDGFTSDTRIGLAINNTTEKDKYNRKIFDNIALKLNRPVYESVSKNKKLSQLYINSTVFCNFVKQELFKSKKGKDKIFNEKWFNQSKENLLGIIEGLRLSDGSFCEHRINFDNTSRSLVNAYKLLCLMTDEGVNSLGVRKEYKTKEGYLCKESYKLRLNKNSNHAQKKNERTFKDNNYYYLPIKEIVILPKQKTTVYDIEVENEHSYLLNNMIVHNSAPSFYVNKLLGFTEIDRLTAPVPLFPTRFMSKTRILQTRSLPDIDLNTSNPEPFIKATEDLLGKENCAWLISYKPMQDSSAFRLWCKSLDMDISEYNEVAKNLELYKDDDKWGKIIEDSKVFVGVVESISPSPCSMVLYDKSIAREIGLVKTKDGICCILDGYYCDKYKYLKND